MAKNMIVGALGAVAPANPAPLRESALKTLMDFWDGELDRLWPDAPDLIVLPECCDRFRGLSIAEYRDFCRFRGDRILEFFRTRAREHRCMIAYAANAFSEDGAYANMLRLIDRSGEVIGTYRKSYPTESELIDGGIQPGAGGVVVDCEFGRIRFAICFDLNFEPLFQFYAGRGIDLLLFSSVFHGGLLQHCRAWQCRSHLIGAISGERCSVLDPQGGTVAESSNYQPRLCTQLNLDCRVVHYDRNFEKLEALKRKYGSGVTIRDPGRIGTVLVSSELDGVTLPGMLAEFEIEDLAHYYQRAMEMADQYRGHANK